ncbi:hypothetical protein F4780DRAFT_760878 [Xylariomycetidae sp. FL0641]|nr:hypothetical protein F4780DRAFT_760878 [Xylariomycetidae sp. FL0641]
MASIHGPVTMGSSSKVQMDEKKIHPFFSARNLSQKDITPNEAISVTRDLSCSPGSDKPLNAADRNRDSIECEQQRNPKRRKTNAVSKISQGDNKAPKPDNPPQALPAAELGAQVCLHPTKNGQVVADDGMPDQAPQDSQVTSTVDSAALPSAPTSSSTGHSAKPEANGGPSKPTDFDKPPKLLKLNPKTGTIGPPPTSGSTVASTNLSKGSPAIKQPSKRGRKPKALLVSIPYGGDTQSRQRIGQHIDNILSGAPRAITPSSDNSPKSSNSGTGTTKSATQKPTTPKKRTPKKNRTPKKLTHPFFRGKSKTTTTDNDGKANPTVTASPKRQTIFTSTPCSPKHSRVRPPKFNIPSLGAKSGVLRIPGAKHPAWPWSGIVHVRDSPSEVSQGRIIPSAPRNAERKAKEQQIQLSEDDSIVHHITSELNVPSMVKELGSLNSESFQSTHPLVRVPSRAFESGRRLQRRIAPELRNWSPKNFATKTHPAVTHAYQMIESSLSAFDRSTCEGSAWTQKYAPHTADLVLQSGREAELLRGWLRKLKVQAVDTGTPEGGSKSKSSAQPQKKRRRKKLEDFVVSSDESEDMDELSEPEMEYSSSQGTRSKKTVMKSVDGASRGSKGQKRLTNAVVLSGPHGCGKTATVYAIAKELDFEIFEINAGARRAGKDILERVGDMTRNHLVQHQQEKAAEDGPAADDETARDLKSGKQGMMTSFFAPKGGRGKGSGKNPSLPSATEPSSSKDQKKPTKSQKQSLILLEEVDVLYEEDKQFWATIITMISQSKRPFVMTCNEESIVPLQSLNLHGIFRFSAPPKELAVDVLLLIAANEGHALRRHAVETLYDSRGHDFRASITELNYWCQIGVGDLRGGFDWFYPRWPKGSDVDEQGDTIRVVSDGTYQTGMGWFNRDCFTGVSASRSKEEELQRQLWEFWGLDILDSIKPRELSLKPSQDSAQSSPASERLELLEAYDSFASSMSDADLCGPHLSMASDQICIDATVPDLPRKARDDFTIGRPLLEVSPSHSYQTTSVDISTTLRSFAWPELHASHALTSKPHPLCPPDESRVVEELESHLGHVLCEEPAIGRVDYSEAFDPIAASEKTMANGYLDPSIFDRTLRLISLDVAPYVRSIVAYEQRLLRKRRSRSSLLSEGGQPSKKRMRTTRSAYSALEGGSRASTRREKYFSADINPNLVLRTGGHSWTDLTVPPMDGRGKRREGEASTEDELAGSSE